MMALLSSATLLKAAPDAFAGDLGEDHIEPGRRGRRDVEMEARMRLEPALHGRGLVGGIVIDDQMKVEIGRGLLIDQLEKAQELAVPMARHARSDHLSVQHVERRKQGRGAVALVVVRHGAGAG